MSLEQTLTVALHNVHGILPFSSANHVPHSIVLSASSESQETFGGKYYSLEGKAGSRLKRVLGKVPDGGTPPMSLIPFLVAVAPPPLTTGKSSQNARHVAFRVPPPPATQQHPSQASFQVHVRN